VFPAARGTNAFLFPKYSTLKGTQQPDCERARSLFAGFRQAKEQMRSSFQNVRPKKERSR
jgi:hypothetical protein